MSSTVLAADFTWFNLVPAYNALNDRVAHALGHTWIEGEEIHSIIHVTLAILSTLIVLTFASVTRAAWAKSDSPEIPEGKFSIRNFIEMLMDGVLGLGEQVFGNRHDARRFLPLIGSLALFIFFSNALSLIPGFAPPTDNLNVTVGPAIVVFLATHFFGVKANGMHYFAHFLGPKIGKLPLLAPLMLPIEVISHVARPLSLSLRLMGNMTGDHKVLAIFLGLTAFSVVFPLPILVLGTIVVIVQTLVFCLLSMVYLSLAIEHSEEGH